MNIRKQSGFTLIELLIYMSLLTVFLLVLTDLLVQTLDLRTSATAQAFVASDGEYIRHRLAYDLRRSSAIAMPASVGTTTNQIQLTIAGSTYNYSLSNSDLILTVGANVSQLNTSSTQVASLSATRVGNGTGNDTLQISYTVESVAIGRDGPAERKEYNLTLGAR
jgi:prepilin-type N-terminal cleavage/methylation domain-containing protein